MKKLKLQSCSNFNKAPPGQWYTEYNEKLIFSRQSALEVSSQVGHQNHLNVHVPRLIMGWMVAAQQHGVDNQPSVTFTKSQLVTFRQLSIHGNIGMLMLILAKKLFDHVPLLTPPNLWDGVFLMSVNAAKVNKINY